MKGSGYLERGRRTLLGRPVRRPIGPVAPPPDPVGVADFELATWRVRPALARMTRADRIVALDAATLAILLILAEHPPGGVNRDELAARVFGPGDPDEHEPKLRRSLSFLRRVFSEDGAVHLENAAGNCYVLRVGAPAPGRALRPAEPGALFDDPRGVAAWLARGRRRGLALGLAALIVVVLTVAFVWLLDRGNIRIRGTVTAISVLAGEPGQNRNPSFSPDGRQLVYSWRAADEGPETLYLRAVAGGARHALTRGDGADRYPVWSPAGNLIAFARETASGCEVRVIAPDGAAERSVGDCALGAAGPMGWAPDGAALVFAHRAAAMLPTQLVSVGLGDGRLSGVTNPVIGMPGDSRPALASSGRRLLFVRTRAVGVADLMLLDLGADLQKLTHDGVPPAGAAWESGGWVLVYAAARAGHSALWRARPDGSPPALLLASDAELREPALSTDGRRVAFEAWHVATRIVALPLADAAGAAAGGRAIAAAGRAAALAPDGSRIVFVATTAGGLEHLVLAAPDGSGAHPLVGLEAEALETPRWSPDVRYVTCAAVGAGRSDVWVVGVDGGVPRRLTRDGASRAPSFSRDGRWVYFGSDRSGSWQVWRQPWPEAGEEAQQLTTEGGLAALESRAGDAVYYVRPDRGGLWRRGREPGGDETLATPELAAADWRNWDVGPDAVWFAARDRADAPPVLARYSIDEERVTRLRGLPELLSESGFALDAGATLLLITEAGSASSQIRMATLE